MVESIIASVIGLLVGAVLILGIVLKRRKPEAQQVPRQVDQLQLQGRFEGLERILERTERLVRSEIAKNREEGANYARLLREEVASCMEGVNDSLIKSISDITRGQTGQIDALNNQLCALVETLQSSAQNDAGGSLKGLSDAVLKKIAELATVQKKQLDSFAKQTAGGGQISDQKLDVIRHAVENRLGQLQSESASTAQQIRQEVAASLKNFNDSVVKNMSEMAKRHRGQMDILSNQLDKLTQSNEKKLESLQTLLEERLGQLERTGALKLQETQQAVGEKLQGTLERRIGESFQSVSDRLDQLCRALSEIQSLVARGDDLEEVSSDVNAPKDWGEVQLENLLDQILAPGQYAKNVPTKGPSGEPAQFAIQLPGPRGEKVWLPIHARFPEELYNQLIEASENSDADSVEAMSLLLETSITSLAKDIHDNYLNPPQTSEFAILFLPIERLYSDVLHKPGLIEQVQREFRVTVAGPTTLAALLNSLKMGFRTFAAGAQSAGSSQPGLGRPPATSEGPSGSTATPSDPTGDLWADFQARRME